ncbi:19274_t:CDS:1, partial [Racocetra fulgida]
WLIRLCEDMDQLLRIWGEVIDHNKDRDRLLRKPFLEQVHYLISDFKTAKSLKKYFDKIPDHFKKKVDVAFRQKSFKLISSPTYNWDKPDTEEMLAILKNPEFNWNKSDLLEVLNEISQSNQLYILHVFLDLLSYWFQLESQEIPLDKIPAICGQWYQHLMDHVNEKKDRYVYNVFSYLSKIYPRLEGHWNILFILVGIAIDRVKQCPEDKILSTVHQIDFQQDIVQSFLRM